MTAGEDARGVWAYRDKEQTEASVQDVAIGVAHLFDEAAHPVAVL